MLCKYLRIRESLSLASSHFSASHHSPVERLRVDLSFLLKDFKNFTTDESSTVDNDGMCVPPLACAFAKMQQHQHIVGVVDEDGFLVLYNSLKTGSASVIKTWQVHSNAVFDLEWLHQEDKILTGSGDQTIALHDVSTGSKMDTFKGHASSVKSISGHTTNDAVFVSGSRDGHIMMWDKRVTRKDGAVPPVNTIYNAHMLQSQHQSQGKLRKKRTSALRDAQQSVTSVLFQNENNVISAGAVDGCLKVWDIRKTYKIKPTGATPLHIFSYPGSNLRRHGYTSLVLDSPRLRLFASCTDDAIYEYNVANYNPDPVQSWRGHKNSTFYVKTAISPDDQFLISGSSDEKAYIWQINKPSSSPFVLESHSAEVTSVAWCPNDITKVVTLSDDTKIKLWRIYCRELKEDLLPERCGQARKLSNERATLTEAKLPTKKHLAMGATPQPEQLKASSTPVSAQSCMRTWLKTRLCSPLENVKKQSGNQSSVSMLTCSNNLVSTSQNCGAQESISQIYGLSAKSVSNFMTSDKLITSENSEFQDSSADCTNCGSDPDKMLNSIPSYSTSDTVSSSCDHSGSTSSESDLSSPVCCPKRLNGTNADISELTAMKSSEQVLPNHEIENVSPKKLKRRLNSGSPASSPKRPCLTNIESNSAVGLVKKSLFCDDMNVTKDLDLITNLDIKNKDFASSGLKKDNKNAAGCEKTLANIFHSTEEDMDSPTLNLPNLVLDEAKTSQTTKGSAKNEVRTRLDWLTRLGMEKQKSNPESKQATATSPKVSKGMKKIQSYFKPKNNT